MGSRCFDRVAHSVTYRHNPYDTHASKTIITEPGWPEGANTDEDMSYVYDSKPVVEPGWPGGANTDECVSYGEDYSNFPMDWENVGYLEATVTNNDIQALYRQVPTRTQHYDGYTNFFIGQTVDWYPERDIVLLERLLQGSINPSIQFYEFFTKRQGRKHWHTVWVESQYANAILQFCKGRAVASMDGMFFAQTPLGLSFITQQCQSQRGCGVPSNPIVVELIGDRSTRGPRSRHSCNTSQLSCLTYC